MKRRTIKNPVRQYKQMMCQLGKLKDKLRDIMEAIPPCYAYDTLPISFDIDKFIVCLTGTGYPIERIDKQIVEKGYICTIHTGAGLQIVLRHDRNWKRHIHIMIDDLDSIISDCNEALIVDVVMAVDALGEEYRHECENIKTFLEEFHSTTVDNVRSAYHAQLVSDDPAFRIAVVERLIDEVLCLLSESGSHGVAEIVGRNEAKGTWVEYVISYRGLCMRLQFWHNNDMSFRVDIDNKYVFIDIEESLALEFLYSSPDEIATFMKRLCDYVDHIEYKKAHYDLGWRPIIKGSLECLCYYSLWHEVSPEKHKVLVKKFESILNQEMAWYLKILTDFEYNGKVYLRDKIGNDWEGCCEGRGYNAKVVINESLYQKCHPDQIRMILLHELCHIKHTAHGRTFHMAMEDMLVRVGLMTEEERVIKYFYSKHRRCGYYESLPLRTYRGNY